MMMMIIIIIIIISTSSIHLMTYHSYRLGAIEQKLCHRPNDKF